MVGDHAGQSTGGDYLDLLVRLGHLRPGAADQILHAAHIAAHDTCLDLRDGVVAQHFIGQIQLHMGEHGGVLGQRIHADPDAGTDAAAHIDPAGVHSVHRGGGAEVQHQKGRTVFFHGGHAGHAPVRTVLVGGGAAQIAQLGKDILVDDQRPAAQILHHGIFQRVHDAGHHAGDDDILDLLRPPAKAVQIVAESEADLVRGLAALRHKTERAQQVFLCQIVETKLNIGVAHVNGQQHSGSSCYSNVLTQQTAVPRWVVMTP